MIYTVLSQQKFIPNMCTVNNVQIYGKKLYLAEDMTHFVYDMNIFKIKFNRIEREKGVYQSNAISGMRGRYNMRVEKYIFDIVDTNSQLTIYRAKDENSYLHNKYEFKFVEFNDMRFEPMSQ